MQPALPVRRLRPMDQRHVALAQGAYYLASGIWPILHLRSFEAVTGPKPEGWLVKTVGALVAATGAALVAAAVNRRITPELAGLAMGSAASLAAVDTIYAAKRRISPVYVADAFVEAALIGAWIRARQQENRGIAP